MTDRPDELRDRAARARQCAGAFMLVAAGPRLIAHADELDALAETLEAAERLAVCGPQTPPGGVGEGVANASALYRP